MASRLSYAQLFSFSVEYTNPDEKVRQTTNLTWSNLISIVKDNVRQKPGEWRKCVLEVNFSTGNLFLQDKDSNISTHLFTEYKTFAMSGSQDEDTLITLRFSGENWQLLLQSTSERNTVLHLLECCKKGLSAEAAAKSGKGLNGLDKTVLRSGMLMRQGITEYNANERYLVLVPGKLLLFKTMDIQGKHARFVTTLVGARVEMKQALEFRIQTARMKEVIFLPARPEDMTAWIGSFEKAISIGDRIVESNPEPPILKVLKAQGADGDPYEDLQGEASSSMGMGMDMPRPQSAPARTPVSGRDFEQPRVRGGGMNLARKEPEGSPWKVERPQLDPAFNSFQSATGGRPQAGPSFPPDQSPYDSRGGSSTQRSAPNRPAPIPTRFQTELSRENSPSRNQYPEQFAGDFPGQSFSKPTPRGPEQGRMARSFPGGTSVPYLARRSIEASRSDFLGAVEAVGSVNPTRRPSRGGSLPPPPSVFGNVQAIHPVRGEPSNQYGAQEMGQPQDMRNQGPFQGASSSHQQHQQQQQQQRPQYQAGFPGPQYQNQGGYQRGPVNPYGSPPQGEYPTNAFQGQPSSGPPRGQFQGGYGSPAPMSNNPYAADNTRRPSRGGVLPPPPAIFGTVQASPPPMARLGEESPRRSSKTRRKSSKSGKKKKSVSGR